jgi:hypothetical protein
MLRSFFILSLANRRRRFGVDETFFQAAPLVAASEGGESQEALTTVRADDCDGGIAFFIYLPRRSLGDYICAFFER